MLRFTFRTFFSALLFASLLLLPACQSEEKTEGSDHDTEAEDVEHAAARSASAADARVYIISPADGSTVTSPVAIQFGIEGMGVVAAGTVEEHSGHHHLLIDLDELPALEYPIPNDENHRHFGGAQTETSLELEPGTHTLQLILGDHAHVPHDPAVVSDLITITVE